MHRGTSAVPALYRLETLCRTLCAGVLFASSVSLAQNTAVQGFDLERVIPNPGSSHSWLLATGDALEAGQLRVSLTGHYEHDPLVLKVMGARVGTIVGSRFTTHVGAAWGVLDWLEVDLALPVVVAQGGDDLTSQGLTRVSSTSLGSPVVATRFTLLRQNDGAPLDLGWSLGLSLPLGSSSAYTKDPGLGLGVMPSLGAGRSIASLIRVGAEVGIDLRTTQVLSRYTTSVRDEVGSTLAFGATAATLGNSLRGELDVRALVPLTKTSLGVEVLGGVRYPLAQHTFEVFALVGAGAGQLPGTPMFRVMAGLAWTPQPVVPAGPLGQRAEPLEVAPVVAQAPSDRDADGVPDDEDDCLQVWGDVRWQGCPAPHSDPAPLMVDSTEYFFDTRVNFELDAAVVQADFRAALQDVAAAFLERDGSARLVVVGHTDSTGPLAYNQRLSERRAAAVRDVLVEAGVEAGRIELRGFGMTRPVASNADGTGRAMNRRVEFIFTPDFQVGTHHEHSPSRSELHVDSSGGLRPRR